MSYRNLNDEVALALVGLLHHGGRGGEKEEEVLQQSTNHIHQY
jgi:hypothetical protein